MQQEMRHGLVVAEGLSEVAVEDTFPVAEILLAKRHVEAVGVAGSLDVGRGCAFAEHLLDGVTGDEVDEQKNEGDDEPEYWEGVEDALEEEFQFSVLSSRFSVLGSQFLSSQSLVIRRWSLVVGRSLASAHIA